MPHRTLSLRLAVLLMLHLPPRSMTLFCSVATIQRGSFTVIIFHHMLPHSHTHRPPHIATHQRSDDYIRTHFICTA